MKRLSFFLLFVAIAIAANAGDYAKYYENLTVAMTEPGAPTIPDYAVSIADFGAKGDGVTDNTEAFRKAVSHLDKKGGGHLNVPAGIYLTGLIRLKSHIDLHLERNALILASPERSSFIKTDEKTGKKDAKATPAITASKATDISITGEGIIDGNGKWWRAAKREKMSDVEWKQLTDLGGTTANNGRLWYPFGLKNFDNIAPTYEEQEKMRTHLIRLTDCQRVLIKGVTVQNSPKFHIVPQRCSHVVIDGVTVRCPWNAQNGDGIDLMQCREVLVTGCTVDVGDDGICLKGGVAEEGVKHGPCEHILITGNTVFHAHGGFVIGSEFSGGMFDIVVRGNTFSGTDTGLRFKSGAGRGGKTRGIHISDIYMSDIKDEAITFETSYADRPVGSTATTKPKAEDFIPEFSDIHISRITCRDTKTAISAKGTKEMIHDITVDNSIFFYTKNATLIDDPAMIKMTGVQLNTYQ